MGQGVLSPMFFYHRTNLSWNNCREELSRQRLGFIEEEEKKAKEGYEERIGEDGEKKINGTLDPEVNRFFRIRGKLFHWNIGKILTYSVVSGSKKT